MAVFLFDMDGLLLDTEREHWLAFEKTVAVLGISRETDYGFFLSLVGCSTQMTTERLTEYLAGHTTTDAFLEVWNEEAHARAKMDLPLRPFVREVLERLSREGHRMAVVTSSPGDRARGHMAQVGLADHFECVTGGDEVSANKPDPAPYLETAMRMGADPTACYAFEDSDRGIESAVRAGCIATQIPDLRAVDVPLPTLGQHVAPDLHSALVQLGVF